MSKEVIEQLLSEWQRMHSDFAYRPAPKLITEAADRIEELEREVERKMSAADFILKERDALQADRDEWKARAEFSYRQRDELNRLCEFNEKTMSTLQADNTRLREALENCRLLAARHRKEEWAGHVLRLCESAGVAATALRSPK